MSLKAFHIAFVSVSTLLAFGVAGWSIATYASRGGFWVLVFGAGWLLGGLGLIAYGKAMLKKLKHISYL
jgi:hypothetical protein